MDVGLAAATLSPVVERQSTAVTADPLPTTQINGVVWSQVTNGDTVYSGGQFTMARPAGARLGEQQTRRSNLLKASRALTVGSGSVISH